MPSLLLNIVQSDPIRSHVELAPAFHIEIVTFGHTVEFAPFVMVMEGFEEEIDPKVRAFCLLLKIFQSVAERAPVFVADARERDICCHASVKPFAVPRVTAACEIPLKLNIALS